MKRLWIGLILLIVLNIACGEPESTVCTDNAQCGQDEYCATSVGECGAEGTCTPIPDVCVQVYDPVCGCDGTTYANACEANRAVTNVASSGACVPQPPSACSINLDCGPMEYCAKAQGDCAGTGTCTTRPEICITLYAPVTGCDGKIYGNSCEAARAGVNLR